MIERLKRIIADVRRIASDPRIAAEAEELLDEMYYSESITDEQIREWRERADALIETYERLRAEDKAETERMCERLRSALLEGRVDGMTPEIMRRVVDFGKRLG